MVSGRQKKPVYRRVMDAVMRDINAGRYDQEGRLPSDGQLTRRFATSRMTVIKAMTELEHEGVLERRVGRGSFVTRRAMTGPPLVSLVVTGIRDLRFFESVCGQIVSACFARELKLHSAFGNKGIVRDDHSMEQICNRYIEQGVQGVFFAASAPSSSEEYELNCAITDRLRESGIQVVLVCRDLPRYPLRSRYDLAGVNDMEAGYLQARHLIAKGCKRILHVSPSWTERLFSGRRAGYQIAMEEAQLPCSRQWSLVGETTDRSFIENILRFRPDGIICFNDYSAIPILNFFRSFGIRVPEDILLIGFDDTEFASFPDVSLTTMAQPVTAIATGAVDLMLDRINGSTQPARALLFSATLIERHTTWFQHGNQKEP